MFGGLHIEMTALKMLGDLLEGSGWIGALVQAEVATSGTANSFLRASHVTRTRCAHQITASALYLLLQKAYTEYCDSLTDGNEQISLDEWGTKKISIMSPLSLLVHKFTAGTHGDDLCSSN